MDDGDIDDGDFGGGGMDFDMDEQD